MSFPERGVTIAVAVTEQGESRVMNAVMAAALGIVASSEAPPR